MVDFGELVLNIFGGTLSVCFVGLVYCILYWGYVTTFGWSLDGEAVCESFDAGWNYMKWLLISVFMGGVVVGWQESIVLGTWGVCLYLGRQFKKYVVKGVVGDVKTI